MLVSFELSMPSAASWTGKWSGEGRPYVRVRKVNAELAKTLRENYFYRWDDGWCVRVDVSIVDGRAAAKLRKKSVGFSGYDWMIDSILERGYIESESDRTRARMEAT